MSEKNITALEKDFTQKQVAPAYFFYGPEEYLADQALSRLKETIIEPGTEDFNWNVFRADADDLDWAVFADALTSLPLLPSHRVVVLKRFEKVTRNKSVLQLIERTLNSGATDLTVVLMQSEAPDWTKPAYKKIGQLCSKVVFNHPKVHELQSYLAKHAASFGKTLESDASERILTQSEPSLRELFSKLEVLIFYVGEKETIELSDVETCTAFTREVEIFNLLQALGGRQAGQVRRIVDLIMQQRVDTGALISLMQRQVWALYRMRYLHETRVPQSKWQQSLNIRPQFLFTRYKQYLSNYDRGELGRSLDILAQADLERKTTGVSNELLLRRLTEQLLKP
ncbi:DNA polymerase III subunit delta [bacterium]|nr:DNA polymerase III subunit delta [bacterium]MBU1652677.1 DNA polymerase III subunit delta [bacterium]MBU1880835.1 DNA polymerase III subunit delta [bacterium]